MSLHRHKALTVRLDRVQWVSWAAPNWRPPTLSGFKVVFDHRLRQRGKIPTYGRCRFYQSISDDTKIFWYYERLRGWLKRWKVTVIADDEFGLSAGYVHQALKYCRFYRFTLIELALDFDPSIVDYDFVRRHAVFGKSRRR